MVKIKLVGSGRFMNKEASPNVILKGEEVEVNDKLAKALLNATRTDALNNIFPMFVKVDAPESEVDTTESDVEVNADMNLDMDNPQNGENTPDPEKGETVSDEETVKEEEQKPAPKPKATRKKSARSRS